ncbi:hypothetical protein SteCoe_17751 [Stentor coeruleus]|uniref:Uncharacterized protein n=1 Tax=Stentor coeruleus TaxID=5963 RepID=A0A1R2BYC6_9CILI|nr:hypothetical protein SteCoe_17751 [Stentor coeruleus]
MDYRMSNYGARILSSNNSHHSQSSSFSYSPQKNHDYFSRPNDQISDINTDIFSRRKHSKPAEIIEGLLGIVDSLASKQLQYKTKPITPAIAPVNNNSSSSEMSVLMQSFQKQQDMMFQFMENLTKKKEKRKSSKNTLKNHSLEDNYKKIKQDPEKVKSILAELNFNDDGAEDFADKERKLKFSANLSEEEKIKIVSQLVKNKDRIIKGDYGLKGIRKFRMIGFSVLFPIYLVSNMLEKKAKFYMENMIYMKEQIEVFKEVTQAWALKAMKSVLVSTINDANLDLLMPNREKDIKKKNFTSKVMKLQVRVTGIIEGLEKITNEANMQPPFRSFFERYTSNKTFIPRNFLSPFEISRLEFNEFGGLVNQTDDKKRMMLCFFVISKIIIGEICLKPIEAGIPITKDSKTVMNLKMIGSILQNCVLLNYIKVNRRVADYSVEENEIIKRKRGGKFSQKNEDNLSEKLLLVTEYEPSYVYLNQYIEMLKKRIYVWSGEIVRICQDTKIRKTVT